MHINFAFYVLKEEEFTRWGGGGGGDGCDGGGCGGVGGFTENE